jgi:hypothetical protein
MGDAEHKKLGTLAVVSMMLFIICAIAAGTSLGCQKSDWAKSTTDTVKDTDNENPKPQQQQKDPAVQDTEASQALMNHIEKCYGDKSSYKTPWFDFVEDIKVFTKGNEKWAVVDTNLFKDYDEGGEAQQIAEVIISNARIENIADLDWVNIKNKNGLIIKKEYSS